MPNHPRRAVVHVAPSPDPADIKAARQSAGMTQPQAAAVVYVTLRNWQQWEGAERRMHPGLWELFQIKVSAPAAINPSASEAPPMREVVGSSHTGM